MDQTIDVDPGELRVPPSRPKGADSIKLTRQIAKYADKFDGMPPVQLVRGRNGELRINDGVTRATRAHRLRPGVKIPAIVIHDLPRLDVSRFPKIKDLP